MPVIYEHDGSTPLPPDTVDGMAYLLDPEEDVGPTWDPTVDDFPSYLNLDGPSMEDCALALHELLTANGGPEGVAGILLALKADNRSALLSGLIRLGGVLPEHDLAGDLEGLARFLSQLDVHYVAHVESGEQDDRNYKLVAELRTDLLVSMLVDPYSPEVDGLVCRLAQALR